MLRSRTIPALALAAVLLPGCADQSDPLAPAGVYPASSKLSPSLVLSVPEDSPGPPFYSNSSNGAFIPHDDDHAAFPFLRELSCVPQDANLLVLVGPSAFGCTLTIEGHEHWEHGPGIDPAPRQTVFRGLGTVPIVFADWAEVQTAIADGTLTLPELLALHSAVVGTADFYKESNVLGISGPHGLGKGSYKIAAQGTLNDGTAFRLHVNEVLGELRVVQIDFRS